MENCNLEPRSFRGDRPLTGGFHYVAVVMVAMVKRDDGEV